jgi:hypothetical protein
VARSVGRAAKYVGRSSGRWLKKKFNSFRKKYFSLKGLKNLGLSLASGVI